MDRVIYRTYKEWQPKEGWLPVVLIFAIGSAVITAVIESDWVPEVGVIGWTVTVSLLLSIILAKRPISWMSAALLSLGYGSAITVISLARLVPPLTVLAAGFNSSLTYIRQSLFLFGDRIGGWLEAVANGESSEETIVFALGLGLISWFLFAYAGWTTFRQQNPLNGLILIGTALALNTFYGKATEWSLIIYISLAVLLTASIHMADMQQFWDRRQIDYPTDIKIELLLTAVGVSVALMALSLVIPTISIRAIIETFNEQQAVQQAEESLERAFAGVNVGEGNLAGQDLERGGGDSALPRSFLLGNPPELAETLVMTATVQANETAEGVNWPVHWRAFSYDVYNGRGWSVSNEREATVAAGERIPLPPIEIPRILTQSIFWQLNNTNTRYTMGLPLRFDHDVTVHWRGLSDLSQVRGTARNYTAESQIIGANPADLRQAELSDVPDIILARYTALPDDIPDRVIELAQEAAFAGLGGQATVYDQTKAIEQFLRQYPYTLNLPLPPRDQDLVDYFLFNLQSGYCDYYATSMVVMARSLGIPARFATGFLAQPPDENGVQQIYQLNAHSWAEVYFAGYGWVEFEPTAAFPSQADQDSSPAFEPSEPPAFSETEPLALPSVESVSRANLTNVYFLVIVVLFVAAVGTMVWLMRGKRTDQDIVSLVYGRLQKNANRLGQPTPASQTPIEFETRFKGRLKRLTTGSQLASGLIEERSGAAGKHQSLPDETAELAALYMAHQYQQQDERQKGRDSYRAERIWQRIRLRLWLLAIINKLRKF